MEIFIKFDSDFFFIGTIRLSHFDAYVGCWGIWISGCRSRRAYLFIRYFICGIRCIEWFCAPLDEAEHTDRQRKTFQQRKVRTQAL